MAIKADISLKNGCCLLNLFLTLIKSSRKYKTDHCMLRHARCIKEASRKTCMKELDLQTGIPPLIKE